VRVKRRAEHCRWRRHVAGIARETALREDQAMSPQFSLEHIGLAAQDTTALKNWYEKTLGARVVYASAQLPTTYFIELPGGARVEIYQGNYSVKEVADNNLQGWRHLALSVESITRAKAELESKGVHFTEAIKPAGGGGQVLFFQDPEGNLLHLIERPSDSTLRR
jgi:catechol 2,3-dioxygenase-like lactoylglutathione lyase family enzyme